MSPNKHNSRFLKEQAQIIRETENHPLSFLLGSNGELMTLSKGYKNYYDAEAGAIFEGRANGENQISFNSGESSLEASETLGCSVSVDACHVLASSHGGTRLALGISERNRADGYAERNIAIENEVVDVSGVPVFKQALKEWSEFALCDKELVDNSPESDGWTSHKSGEVHMSMYDDGKRKAGYGPEFQSGGDDNGDKGDPFAELKGPEAGEALRQSEMLPNANMPEADIQRARHELAHPDDLDNALYGSLGDADQQAQESLKNEVSRHNFDTYCEDAISAKPDTVSLFLNTETRREGQELSGISYSLEGVQGDNATSLVNMEAQFRRDGDSVQCDSNIGQDNDFSALSQNLDSSQDAPTESSSQSQDFSSDFNVTSTDASSDMQVQDAAPDMPPEPQKDTSSDF